jgi:predicted RNA-binding protein with PUA-like domain
VDVKFGRKLARTISLKQLKEHPGLVDLQLVQRGNRLSIMPLTPRQWQIILTLE